MPFALGLLIVDLALWLALPRQKSRRGTLASGEVDGAGAPGALSGIRKRLARRRSSWGG